MKKPIILILGITGMVGKVVYSYLKQNTSLQIFGTIREKTKHTFSLEVKTAQKDLISLYKNIGTIDYIINCIGEIKKNADKPTVILTNSLFPHILEAITKKQKTRLIHISTDAVFGKKQKTVTEKDIPYPDTIYGISKLLGECEEKNALTIRTSFLGFNQKNLKGYINQTWSGSTTLQFAQFCEVLIEKDLFATIRAKTPIFHFVPIQPTTKYEIVKETRKLFGKSNTSKKVTGENINRILASNYPSSVLLRSYSKSIEASLKELYDYNKKR